MKLPSVKTRYFVLHPTSYGVGTLGRIGFRLPDGRSILLHYFPPQEPSSRYHDHPWAFTTLVLWGGYLDLSVGPDGEVVQDRLRMGSVRRRAARHRHKTKVSRRTFTVIVTSRTEREWCEGTPDEWVCGGDLQDFADGLGMNGEEQARI